MAETKHQGSLVARLKGAKLREVYAAVAIGLCAGLAADLLKFTVHATAHGVAGFVEASRLNALYFILPFVGIGLTALFTRYLVRDDLGHGVSKVLKARAKERGILPVHAMVTPLIGCTMTVGLGGSAGMEAPVMHAGSAIGSNIARSMGFDRRTRTIMLGAGAAAAVAAVYKAPVAGIVLALEVLLIDSTPGTKLPLIIASVIGALAGRLATGDTAEMAYALIEPFKASQLPWFLLLGLACGLMASYMQAVNGFCERSLARIKNWRLRVVVGAAALGALVLAFPPLYGEGSAAIRAILSGRPESLVANSFVEGEASGAAGGAALWLFLGATLLLKPFATGITTGSGGVGGVFAPSLFMGALCGRLFGRGLEALGRAGWDAAALASAPDLSLVGMAAFLAALMHAPLTGVFLIAELTGGYQLLIPLMVAVLPAYGAHRLLMGHSIYASGLAREGALVTHDKDAHALMETELPPLLERDFLALKPDDPLSKAREAFLGGERLVLPVLGELGSLVGVVDFDDMRAYMGDEEASAGRVVYELMAPAEALRLSGLKADAALDAMDAAKQDWLPVEDEDNRFIGFIAKTRLLEAYRATMIELTRE